MLAIIIGNDQYWERKNYPQEKYCSNDSNVKSYLLKHMFVIIYS